MRSVEDHEVRIRSRRDLSLAMKQEDSRRVRREHGKDAPEGVTVLEKAAEAIGKGGWLTDVHSGHPAIGIETRQTSAGVGAHGEPVRRKIGREILQNRVLGGQRILVPAAWLRCLDAL